MFTATFFPDAADRNMKGRPCRVYDQSGVISVTKVDFKGNPMEAERRFTIEYKNLIDWKVLDGLNNINAIDQAAEPQLQKETFTSSAVLDALNRPESVTLPDNSVIRTRYNELNYPDKLDVKIMGTGNFVSFLDSQDYDAKGQRQFVKYGNGTVTRYFYDPLTFRLDNLLTKLDENDNEDQSIRDLRYTFDPVGNITQIRDDAQQTHYFKNAVISPENKFEYDALYRLISATGREHAGPGNQEQRDHRDLPFLSGLPQPNNANAVRNYAEKYEYDDCGNLISFRHIASQANWTRRYKYIYQDDPADLTNRLKATSLPGDADGVFSAAYTYDLHGNMTSMPHLPAASSLQWDYSDSLKQVSLGGGGTAFYVYGLNGTRIRKVIERNGGKKIERIYLGITEIYRESQGANNPGLERYTLHISDNTGRIAQVDTKTIDTNNSDPANPLNAHLIRYQYANQVGSAMVETDAAGTIISYEEYHPFGTTSYRVSKPGSDLSLKRYRFNGKEQDDETGFYYFGARYYAPWLGRWISSDPSGFVDGLNLYTFCKNNPAVFKDINGRDSEVDQQLEKDFYIEEGGYIKRNPAFKETGRILTVGRGTYAQYKNPKWGLVWVKFAEDIPTTREVEEMAKKDEPIVIGTIIGHGKPMTEKEFKKLLSGLKESKDKDTGGGDLEAKETKTDDKTKGGTGDTKEPPKSTDDTSAKIAGSGTVTTWDSRQRGKYVKGAKEASEDAQKVIHAAKEEGDAAKAMKAAEDVSKFRNDLRLSTQEKLSPGGKALSKAIEGERDLAKIKTTYAKRLPGVEGGAIAETADEIELARRIAVAAGESRPAIKVLAKTGKVLGPVGIAVGAGIGIYEVVNAPEGQKGRVAAREGGSFAGGLAGASLGMSAGVAVAGFISGFLIGLGVISGPLGWLAIGLGIVGGMVGAYLYGKLGGALGEKGYDLVAD